MRYHNADNAKYKHFNIVIIIVLNNNNYIERARSIRGRPYRRSKKRRGKKDARNAHPETPGGKNAADNEKGPKRFRELDPRATSLLT